MTQWMTAIATTVILWAASGYAVSEDVSVSRDYPLDCYISTGDNHWLGLSLPIDTPAAIEASFDLMHDLGVRRVYWRGLEAATWVEGYHIVREENCRYHSFWEWLRYLYKEVQPDRLAVSAAKKRGMEIWGVATLVDWGSQADVPPFGDYPFNSESSLRIDNPEWVPVDKYGILKQGGTICFCYPQARKALVDLHMKFMNRDGYDGMTFLTYAENHSMRFQDEFGYNEPIVEDFKRRHGIDIRFEDWTRFASRFDWYKLRGEYLTAYLRELKAELDKNDQKLGVVLQSWEPHFTQPWNVPELMLTAGHMYQDLETWIGEGIVDEFEVYGYCDPQMQVRAVKNMRWMTRDTDTQVSLLTSSPASELWKQYRDKGVPMLAAWGEDAMYLQRSGLAEVGIESLESSKYLDRMKALSQIIHGTTAASVEHVSRLIRDENLIVRRLALSALGEMKDAAGVVYIEEGLRDKDLTVRYAAMGALRHNSRPESLAVSVAALDASPVHPMAELARNYWLTCSSQRDELLRLMQEHPNAKVRSTAARALHVMATPAMVPALVKGMDDPDRYVRFAATRALGSIKNSEVAIESLIEGLLHQDAVVNNRAATSLGEVVMRGSVNDALRKKMLAGLIGLYRRSGDESQRADIEWGYRPVGEAILCFGQEGELALQQMMDQDKDVRLAVHAWKTLYIRKSPNSFSEVTERQNEQYMRLRPASLRTREYSRLLTTWDKDAAFIPAATGMLGNVNKSTGRWGAFSPSGPAISTQRAHSGTRSVKLIRGGGALSGSVLEGVALDVGHELRFCCYRESENSGFVAMVKGYEGVYRQEMAVMVNEAGVVYITGGEDEGWTKTDLVVPVGQWCKIHLVADSARAAVSAVVDVAGTRQTSEVTVPYAVVPDVRMVSFFPQGLNNSVIYIDDIELVEMP